MEAAIRAATKPVRFVDCDLQEADLSRLDLSGFTFERCTLIEADLSHVVAQRTTWIGCRARKSLLRGADLTDAVFKGGDWNNSEWRGAMIPGARITGLKLTGADMTDMRALGAAFEDCLMQSAVLAGMSFRKQALGRCDMARADLTGCDLRETQFSEGSSIAHARIPDARFEGTDLRNVDISGHGVASLPMLSGARITHMQAAAIVASAGLKVA